MPFKSKAQMRLFYAKENSGELPKGTAKRWEGETKNIKSLPEHVKKASLELLFSKIAEALFDPMKSKPLSQRIIQKDIIESTKGDKMKEMSQIEYRNEVTARRSGIIARNRQTLKPNI